MLLPARQCVVVGSEIPTKLDIMTKHEQESVQIIVKNWDELAYPHTFGKTIGTYNWVCFMSKLVMHVKEMVHQYLSRCAIHDLHKQNFTTSQSVPSLQYFSSEI